MPGCGHAFFFFRGEQYEVVARMLSLVVGLRNWQMNAGL